MVAILVGLLFVAGYAALALGVFGRYRGRVWPLVGGAIFAAAVGLAATVQRCPRHGPVTAALAAWIPAVLLVAPPLLAGALAALVATRIDPRPTVRGFALTAGATVAGLTAGAVVAFQAWVAFYGPDCWP